MDEVVQILTQAVANGPVGWDVFIGAVPQHLRRHINPALRQLESEGVLHRMVDGTVTPPVFQVRPGQKPE